MTIVNNRSQVIEIANQRFKKLFVTTTIGMIIYGLLLPNNWELVFGPLAFPITWAANTAPATIKAASVSPIPALVKGFYGLASWVSVIFSLILASNDPLVERVKFAFSRPDWPVFKTFLFIYFIGLPFVLAGLWVIFFMPISIEMSGGTTWGMRLLVGMISDRFTMAFIGGLATTSIGMAFFSLIVFIVGPIVKLFNGE